MRLEAASHDLWLEPCQVFRQTDDGRTTHKGWLFHVIDCAAEHGGHASQGP